MYVSNYRHGYVVLFRDPQALKQHLKLIRGESNLQESFATMGNALRELFSPPKRSSTRLSLPRFNNIQQFSLACWLNEQQQKFTA